MIYSTWMRRFHSFILTISMFSICAQSDVPRPRGVSPSKASLYSPTKDFTCFDGTATIPFGYVNDDYCDCFDGSDEPGTSACLNGMFYCTNAGHRPENIPSSRVNDGVCDCCDGSDEYTSTSTCLNTCDELGREARAEAQRLSELHKAGSQIRQELIEKGNYRRNEMTEQLAQFEKDKSEAEKIKVEKEYLKNELESKENEVLKVYREAEEQERQRKAEQEREKQVKDATDQFNRFDSNSDGILVIDEIKVVNVFDKNKDGEVDAEEIQYFFGEKENVDLENFVTSVWPLLKPLLMMEQGMFRPAETEKDEELTENDDDEAEDLPLDADAEDLDNTEDGDLDLPQDDGDEHTLDEDKRTYDEDTQKIVDEATEARRQFTDAERTVREIESSIRNIQQNLEKDYGPQQEYATLDGQCFEYEDKEYIYKLCLFQKVTQKSKQGHAEIGLGNWGEWAGGENNKYSIMKYTNGVACWNGPNRVTSVYVQCGLETKLLSVTEPFRCEYKIEFSTPAACHENHESQDATHDEL